MPSWFIRSKIAAHNNSTNYTGIKLLIKSTQTPVVKQTPEKFPFCLCSNSLSKRVRKHLAKSHIYLWVHDEQQPCRQSSHVKYQIKWIEWRDFCSSVRQRRQKERKTNKKKRKSVKESVQCYAPGSSEWIWNRPIYVHTSNFQLPLKAFFWIV